MQSNASGEGSTATRNTHLPNASFPYLFSIAGEGQGIPLVHNVLVKYPTVRTTLIRQRAVPERGTPLDLQFGSGLGFSRDLMSRNDAPLSERACGCGKVGQGRTMGRLAASAGSGMLHAATEDRI